MYDIFDAHCHIYPADIAPRAVAGVNAFYGGLPVKPRDGTVATLLRCTWQWEGMWLTASSADTNLISFITV